MWSSDMSRGSARLHSPRGIGPLVVCPGARQNARGVAHGPSRQWKYEGRPQIDRTLDVDLPGFREGSGEGGDVEMVVVSRGMWVGRGGVKSGAKVGQNQRKGKF